jgi:hypothetical protein
MKATLKQRLVKIAVFVAPVAIFAATTAPRIQW